MFFYSRLAVRTAVTALVPFMAAGGVPAQGQTPQAAGEAATPTRDSCNNDTIAQTRELPGIRRCWLHDGAARTR